MSSSCLEIELGNSFVCLNLPPVELATQLTVVTNIYIQPSAEACHLK